MKSTQRTQYLAQVLLVGLCVFGVIGCSRSKPDETADVDQIRIVPKRSGNAVELFDLMNNLYPGYRLPHILRLSAEAVKGE